MERNTTSALTLAGSYCLLTATSDPPELILVQNYAIKPIGFDAMFLFQTGRWYYDLPHSRKSRLFVCLTDLFSHIVLPVKERLLNSRKYMYFSLFSII